MFDSSKIESASVFNRKRYFAPLNLYSKVLPTGKFSRSVTLDITLFLIFMLTDSSSSSYIIFIVFKDEL